MESAVVQIKNLLSKASQIQMRHKEWLFKGKWLRAGCVHYISPAGQERTWETMERTTTVPTLGVDGADVIGIMRTIVRVLHTIIYYL